MSSSSNKRRYSEQEIQAIFRRATERQEAAGSSDPHRGLTLEELKAIGAESGIDPAHIEGAAADIERGAETSEPPSGVERFYGMSASIHAERVLPGTMDDATWEEVVEALRSIFNTRGQAEQIGPIREWSAFTSSGFDYQALMADDTWYTFLEGMNLTSNKTRSPVHVEVKPEADGTRVKASYRMPPSRLWEGPGILGGFWLAALITSLVYLFVSLPVAFLLVPLNLFLIGGGVGAYQRHAHRSELQTTRQRIDKAMERIGYLQAAKTGSASEARSNARTDSETAAPSSLDWDTEDDASTSTGSASRRRERS